MNYNPCGELAWDPSNDGSYQFFPGTDFDYLSVGESAQVTFYYTASDIPPSGSVGTSDPQLVTITIDGEEDSTTIFDDSIGFDTPIYENGGEISFTLPEPYDLDDNDQCDPALHW